jgi:GTPase SAR1 family protein
MGGIIEKFMNSIFKRKEVRLMMLGLDAAGKTSILYRLKFE